jgi:hypothetical protein
MFDQKSRPARKSPDTMVPNLIENCLVSSAALRVNSVFTVPRPTFLYSFTSGSIISNHIFGKNARMIIREYP